MKSIVIAKYKEDISWVRELDGWNVHIIDKHNNTPDEVGNEANTYFLFIVNNYNSLSGTYVFCQGHPFDHHPDFLDNINHSITGRAYPRNNRTDPSRKVIELQQYCDVLGLIIPNEFTFYNGAQFKTTAESIKKHPLSFYETCLELTKTDNQSCYIFEALWQFIFECI